MKDVGFPPPPFERLRRSQLPLPPPPLPLDFRESSPFRRRAPGQVAGGRPNHQNLLNGFLDADWHFLRPGCPFFLTLFDYLAGRRGTLFSRQVFAMDALPSKFSCLSRFPPLPLGSLLLSRPPLGERTSSPFFFLGGSPSVRPAFGVVLPGSPFHFLVGPSRSPKRRRTDGITFSSFS